MVDHHMDPMDGMSDSEDNCGYNSDDISSDLEVQLYGAIYHTYTTDGQQLTTNFDDMSDKSMPNEAKTMDRQLDPQLEPLLNDTDKPLTNIFRFLDQKQDVSDDEMDKDFVFEDNTNHSSDDVIVIDDSSDDDSDVAIINNKSFDSKRKDKSSAKRSHPNSSANSSSVRTDISLGNVNNLNETTLSAVEAMDQFYNEDLHDSDEEERSFNAMSGDRRFWRISLNDSMVTKSNPRSSRYYVNKQLCLNCNERGHLARNCPLPKKLPSCFMCGRTGHRSDRCKSMVCSKCYSSAHKTINCNALVETYTCEVCGVRGHQTNQCTYNWRKYHLTTTYTGDEPYIDNLSSNRRKSCCNCGAIGKHFVFECHSKPMSRYMTRISPLMSTIRQSHCFNGRKDSNNRRNDCNQKALCNEFAKSISSNELRSCLSASFNKPLDDSDLCHTIANTSTSDRTGRMPSHTVTSTPATHIHNASHKKNKHIKWIYPQMNDSLVSDSYEAYQWSPIVRKSPKKLAFGGERVSHTMLNESMPQFNAHSSAHTSAQYSAIDSAHTLTRIRTPTSVRHRQINNSIPAESQTTLQHNERSAQRRLRRKQKKLDKKAAQRDDRLKQQHLLREPNGSQLNTWEGLNTNIPWIRKAVMKSKNRKKFRREKNRNKKRENMSQ